MTTDRSPPAPRGEGSPPVLRLEGVTTHFLADDSLLRRFRPDRRRPRVHAVDDVTLAVRHGETLGLVGESGCGKSTLARTALRLVGPTEGHIYFEGEDITEYDQAELRDFRSSAQMIFQDPFASLNPRYTVRRTLVEPMTVHDVGDSRTDRIRRAAALLERVGLEDEHLDRYPHEFSGGQRQRIAICRALSVEPELLVADEPTSALDVSIQAQILRLLGDLQTEMGLSMVFISHDLSVIRRIADRVAVMYLGEIVETGPTEGLFADPAHPYTEVLLSSIPIPDPTTERRRIRLDGDVPTPVDPPTGCRFHTRCPKVIPPDGWPGDQTQWRRVLQTKKRIESGEVRPGATRKRLATDREEEVSDEAVVLALYREHVRRSGVAETEEVTLPDGPQATVEEALSRLVDGEESAAISVLNDAFPTICEERPPRTTEPGEDRTVACHLHDDDAGGTHDSSCRTGTVDGRTDEP